MVTEVVVVHPVSGGLPVRTPDFGRCVLRQDSSSPLPAIYGTSDSVSVPLGSCCYNIAYQPCEQVNA